MTPEQGRDISSVLFGVFLWGIVSTCLLTFLTAKVLDKLDQILIYLKANQMFHMPGRERGEGQKS